MSGCTFEANHRSIARALRKARRDAQSGAVLCAVVGRLLGIINRARVCAFLARLTHDLRNDSRQGPPNAQKTPVSSSTSGLGAAQPGETSYELLLQQQQLFLQWQLEWQHKVVSCTRRSVHTAPACGWQVREMGKILDVFELSR